MSKIYKKYLELKKLDQNKLYLFKSGKFYIFVGEDVEVINEYVVLKKTMFCKNVLKCGFPEESLENYLHVFQNHNLDVQIITELESTNKIEGEELKSKINKLDINLLTPLDALLFLKQLKEEIK